MMLVIKFKQFFLFIFMIIIIIILIHHYYEEGNAAMRNYTINLFL